MATLQNIHGASLVPSLSGGLNALLQTFGTPQSRAADEAARQAEEAQIQAEEQARQDRAILGGATSEALPQPPISNEQQTALDQISTLEPKFSTSLGQVINEGNPVQLAEMKQDFQEDGQLATEIRAMSSHSDKIKAISAKSQEDIASGKATQESTDRALQLLNLSPEELDIQLQKMEVVSNSVEKAIPQTPSFLDSPEKRAAFIRLSGRNPSEANAIIAAEKLLQSGTQERRIIKDANDRQRFADTGELVFPDLKAAEEKAQDGRFSKAPGVIVSLPDGGFAQSIPVLNEKTGKLENKLVPIEGQPVSRLGETPGQIEARAISTAGGETAAELKSQLKLKPQLEAAVTKARAKAADEGQVFTELNQMQAALPGLQSAIASLRQLAPIATSTFGGRVFDAAVKETGFGATKGATAKAKFIGIVNNQVLPLLKPTFGGSFSVQEGESLKATMGDPDASPEEKMVQLDAFIEQKIRDIETRQRQLQGGETQGATPQQRNITVDF